MPMFRYGPGGFHQGPGVFGWFVLALLIAAVIVGVLALVRLWRRPGVLTGHHHPHHAPPWADPAMAELRMRYARGDIDFDEFTKRATLLSQGPAGPPPPPAAPPAP